jgi:hypothetical protein
MVETLITIAENKSAKGDNLQLGSLYKMVTGDVDPKMNELSGYLSAIYASGHIEEYNKYKSECPILMPSGIFEGSKGKDSLRQHSGYMSFDIDPAGKNGIPANEHIEDWSMLKKQISRIANVAYVGHSLSGVGLWGLIPIQVPQDSLKAREAHENYSAALIEDFWRFGIRLDTSCKNVNRLRYYAYDPKGYINLEAIPYSKKIEKKKILHKKRNTKNGLTPWEAYNNDDSDPHLTLLQNEGWKLIESRSKGDDLFFTRPGKSNGISAEYCKSRKWFFVYTSSTVFESGKHYRPSEIFAKLVAGGDWSRASKELKKMNYGK